MRRALFLLLFCLAGSLLAAQAPTDPVAAILAEHRKIDADYARAPMSPFSAIAVRYFAPGEQARLNIGPGGAAFDTPVAQANGLDITLNDGAFWMTPAGGPAPWRVVPKTPSGDPGPGPGTVLSVRTKVTDRDVVAVGRYFVESYARPDTGNVRVFDPEADARRHFAGLKWFAPDLAFQTTATFEPAGTPTKVVITTSRGLQKDYVRAGTLTFTLGGQPQRLTALAMTPAVGAGTELFIAFRDATTGKESYQVGRYLTVKAGAPGERLVLDFNLATNPLCNYSPHYNCPIPPRENTLSVAVRAGEMAYPARH